MDSESRKWTTRIVYLLGGTLYIIGSQEVYYTGAGSMKTFLPPLPYFLGMMLVVMIPPAGIERDKGGRQLSEENYDAKSSKMMLRISLLESTAYLMTYLGIAYAGSTIFTIIYGSMSLVVALVRWLITRRTITRGQFLGISIATLGILSTAVEGLNSPQAHSVELGVIFTLIGCFAYATEYVYLEEALGMFPQRLVLYKLGKYCFRFFALLFITIGLPHHQAWIENQIAAHHGRPEVVVLLYTLLVPCSFLKNYAWMGVIQTDGAVTTGLMQGCRSCLTFLMSSLLFCSPENPNQCFTNTKGMATVLVVTGTIVYSMNVTPKVQKSPPPVSLEPSMV